MPTVRNVGYKLSEEATLGPDDSEPLRPLIRDIVRLWRGHPNFMKTKERRRFVEVLACFHLRVIQALRQRGKETSPDALGACVQHLALWDCPAQETIQLQVTVEGVLLHETEKFIENIETGRDTLQNLRNSINEVQVEDMRRMYDTVEVLHSRLMDYLVKCSQQMAQRLTESDPVVSEAEILASLESVLPRKGLLYWMELSDDEKEKQVQELADIVMGIRVYNKLTGKGGEALPRPDVQFGKESELLSQRIDEALQQASDRIDGLTKGILLYIEEYGIRHIFIQRLKDDLAYSHQTRIYLQTLHEFLFERFRGVLACSEKTQICVDTISSLTETRKSIPGELVFPELRKIGIHHKRMSDDYDLLQAHSKTATALLELIERPYYIQSPITARRLEIKAKNFLFLPRGVVKKDCPIDSIAEQGGPPAFLIKEDETLEEIQSRLQYGGFCPVNLVRLEGVLIRGDPKVGIIQIEQRLFSFADQTAFSRFLKAPQAFIEGVSDIALRFPYLVHILGLNATQAFSFLSIPSMFQMAPGALPRDFAMQTALHPLPMHTWDCETLQKRVEELAKMQTDSSQTTMEVSHFHRASVTQVWPPKDKWTQTGVPNSTSMPRYVRVLHNLRGELHQDFKVIKSSYEWPGGQPGDACSAS